MYYRALTEAQFERGKKQRLRRDELTDGQALRVRLVNLDSESPYALEWTAEIVAFGEVGGHQGVSFKVRRSQTAFFEAAAGFTDAGEIHDPQAGQEIGYFVAPHRVDQEWLILNRQERLVSR